MRRAVISGIGLIGPTGIGLPTFWEALLLGRSGIGRISRFDPTSYSCQIGGEIRDRGYEELLEPRKLRTTTHVTQLAMAAVTMAMRDAALRPGAYEPHLIGVSMGTALGGWREAEQQHSILTERGARRVNPFIANGTPNHTAAAEVAGMIGAQGPQFTFSSGCTSSLQAIAQGAAMIISGELSVCITGGAESPLIPMVIAGMSRTLELSMRNDDPEHASCPFDREHSGLVLSEGSCVLIVEEAEHAMHRGIQPYAEILGSASSCDGVGVYGFDSSGAPGARAIHQALQRSSLSAVDIDYVCAHANSSPAFDCKETIVLKKAFGECAARLPVSSIKGVLGHPFGASGAFQVAASVLAMRNHLIPPTHNLRSPDPECDLDYVPREARPARVQNALVTSYGYGGVNSYLLLAQPRS